MAVLTKVAFNALLGRPKPINLVHFITHRCNARCGHCFIDFGAPKQKEKPLSVDEIGSIAASVAGELVNVNITGGEPFLNREIWPICHTWLARAKVHSIYITTHGGFPDRVLDLANKFLSSAVNGQLFVSISIDDLAPAHDSQRKLKGLFNRAMESFALLKSLRDSRLGAGVSITVTETNHSRVLDIYDILRSQYSVDAITATLRRTQGVAMPLPPETTRQVALAYAALTRQIQANILREPRTGARRSLISRVQDAKDEILYTELRDSALNGNRFRSPCRAGGLFVVMQPNGAIHGCEMRADACLGNVRDHELNLGRILRAPRAAKWRRQVAAERCCCSYECAQGVNIVSNLNNIPALVWKVIRGHAYR